MQIYVQYGLPMKVSYHILSVQSGANKGKYIH